MTRSFGNRYRREQSAIWADAFSLQKTQTICTPTELLSETLNALFGVAGDYLNDPAATEARLPPGWTKTVEQGIWRGRQWYRVVLTDGTHTVRSDPGAMPRGWWSLARAMILVVAAVRSGCRAHNLIH